MNEVIAPDWDLFCDFVSIVQRKDDGSTKDILIQLANDIQRRYQVFHRHLSQLENVPTESRTESEIVALESCYTNSIAFKNKMLNWIKERRLGTPRCSYCQIAESQTWDHFLPSSVFPDFFVLASNLIHVCGNCNSIKGPRMYSPRRTLQPYFDRINGVEFLTCEITQGDPMGLRFFVDTSVNGSPYLLDIAAAHFDTYDLNGKFVPEASRKLSDIIDSVGSHADSLAEPVCAKHVLKVLNQEAVKARKRGEGANSWEMAFLRGLMNYPNLEPLFVMLVDTFPGRTVPYKFRVVA